MGLRSCLLFFTPTQNNYRKKKKTEVTPNIPSGLGTHPETGYTNNFRFPFRSRQGREGGKGTIFFFFFFLPEHATES